MELYFTENIYTRKYFRGSTLMISWILIHTNNNLIHINNNLSFDYHVN